MEICDVCKKELSFGGVAHVTIPHWLFGKSYTYDMCKSCAEKVEDYIMSLAKEAERKKEEANG